MRIQLEHAGLVLVDKIAQAGLGNPSLRPRYGGQDLAYNAYLGAAGEVAAAIVLGVDPPTPGELGRYDVGRVQVRTRSKPGFDLMIAPEDRYHAQDPFVLVWKHDWDTYEVVGQIVGSEAMVPRYWTGDERHYLYRKIPHDCWAVPARDLAPVDMSLIGG